MRRPVLGRVWGHDFYCNSLREIESVGAQVEYYFLHGIEVKPGDVVLDLGANIGLFGLQALVRTGFQATVLSFEPVPDTYSVLAMNCALIDSRRWRAFNYGLANRDGSLTFYHYPNWPMISSSIDEMSEDPEIAVGEYETIFRNLVPRPPGIRALLALPRALRRALITRLLRRLHASRVLVECRVKSLASVIDELGMDTVDLLKIDVEKAEENVIAGIRPEQFQRIKSVVVEVHDLYGRAGRLAALLRSHGFHVVYDQEPAYTGSVIYNLYGRRLGA